MGTLPALENPDRVPSVRAGLSPVPDPHEALTSGGFCLYPHRACAYPTLGRAGVVRPMSPRAPKHEPGDVPNKNPGNELVVDPAPPPLRPGPRPRITTRVVPVGGACSLTLNKGPPLPTNRGQGKGGWCIYLLKNPLTYPKLRPIL